MVLIQLTTNLWLEILVLELFLATNYILLDWELRSSNVNFLNRHLLYCDDYSIQRIQILCLG